MDSNKIVDFFEKPIRLRFRSGKEVFGVLWEDTGDGGKELFFSSSHEFYAYKNRMGKGVPEDEAFSRLKVDLDDIAGAEYLESVEFPIIS